MKLTEIRRKNLNMHSTELVNGPEEAEIGFDPKVDLLAEDWDTAIQDLITLCEAKKGRPRCVKLLMAMQYLDQTKYQRLINSARFKPLFEELSTTETELLRERNQSQAQITHARLRIQDVFPHTEKIELNEVKDFLYSDLRILIGIESVIETLYVLKRLDDEKPILTLTPEQFEQFKFQWNAVWEAGRLEDVAPDKTVRMLAMIRIFDPKLFGQIKLDRKFWILALDWLKDLRESMTEVDDLFQFALNLSILSAEEVLVAPDGKLDIHPKIRAFKKITPLPERSLSQ